MAKQTINNKENAFSVRTKLNENFTELYNHMVTSFNGWGYQDFAAGSITTTSVTITANSNGTGFTFSNTKIINSSAVIVRAADNNKVPYTGSTTLFSSKVSVTGNTGDVVTLSGVPNASWGDCRIFYRYTYEKIPTGYTMAPKFVSSQVLDALDESFVTDETLPSEIESYRFNSVKYNLTPTTTAGIGERFWDIANLTTSLQLPDGGIVQDGQEIFDYYHNLSGVTLVEGDVVSIAGASGNRTAVTLCDATNPLLAGGVIGMVTVPQILPNEVGRVTKFGKVRELNTDAYNEGNAIYVDPLNPGKWTSVMPDAPNYCICIGIINVKHATVGVVDLKLVSLPKLQDLSDINGTPLSTTVSGQIPNWHNDTNVFDFDKNINDYLRIENFPIASENVLGGAYITNKDEVLFGLNDSNIVTPLKLYEFLKLNYVPYENPLDDLNLGDKRLLSKDNYFGDYYAGNYTKIDSNGNFSFVGAATMFEDLNFSPLSAAVGVSAPDMVTINNTLHREFTSSNNQSCGDSHELPHSYKLGSTIQPHLHFFLKSGESSGTTGVTFTFYWELRQTTGTTSGNVTISATSAELAANGNMLNVYGASFAGATTLGAQLLVTIARTAGDAGDVVVTTFGVHYEIDSIGSKEITTK